MCLGRANLTEGLQAAGTLIGFAAAYVHCSVAEVVGLPVVGGCSVWAQRAAAVRTMATIAGMMMMAMTKATSAFIARLPVDG